MLLYHTGYRLIDKDDLLLLSTAVYISQPRDRIFIEIVSAGRIYRAGKTRHTQEYAQEGRIEDFDGLSRRLLSFKERSCVHRCNCRCETLTLIVAKVLG